MQLSSGLTFTGGFALVAPASVLADYLAVAGGGGGGGGGGALAQDTTCGSGGASGGISYYVWQ